MKIQTNRLKFHEKPNLFPLIRYLVDNKPKQKIMGTGKLFKIDLSVPFSLKIFNPKKTHDYFFFIV